MFLRSVCRKFKRVLELRVGRKRRIDGAFTFGHSG